MIGPCFSVISVLSSILVIWLGKRELVALLLLFAKRNVAVIVILLFLMVPWVGM